MVMYLHSIQSWHSNYRKKLLRQNGSSTLSKSRIGGRKMSAKDLFFSRTLKGKPIFFKQVKQNYRAQFCVQFVQYIFFLRFLLQCNKQASTITNISQNKVIRLRYSRDTMKRCIPQPNPILYFRPIFIYIFMLFQIFLEKELN